MLGRFEKEGGHEAEEQEAREQDDTRAVASS